MQVWTYEISDVSCSDLPDKKPVLNRFVFNNKSLVIVDERMVARLFSY